MTTTISIHGSVSNNIYLKLSKTQKTVLYILEKYISGLNQINENDINYLIKYLCENSRRLNKLLSKRKRLSQQIQTKLDLFSFYKKTFSKTQMKLYNDYLTIYNKEKSIIKDSLSLIYDKNSVKSVTYTILNCKSDYNDVANHLTAILFEQNKAIKSLTKVTVKASKFLKSFNYNKTIK